MSEALVSPAWLEEHLHDPSVRVIEIAGMGQEQGQAYASGHIPGAVLWQWKDMLWDSHARDFPSPEDFARRLGAAGISRDTTVVFYGEPMQFGIYAWWTFRYCGHARVCILDGARHRWSAEKRPMTTEVPAAAKAVAYAPVARNEAMRVHREEVLAALGKPDKLLLDGRSMEEFTGERVGAPGRSEEHTSELQSH